MGLALLLAACGSTPQSLGGPTLNDLVDRYISERARLDPSWATYAGLHDFDAHLTRWDDASLKARRDFAERTLAELHKLDPATLGADEKIDYRLWEQDLVVELYDYVREDPRAKAPRLPLDALDVVNDMLLKDYAPLPERVKNVCARLREVPLVVDDAMNSVQRPPKLWTDRAITDAQSVGDFFDKDLPELAGGKTEDLRQAIFVARDALDRYRTFLEETVRPRSDGAYAVGRDAYDFYLKHRHHLSMNADELLALGRREFDRTLEMMNDIAWEIDHPPDSPRAPRHAASRYQCEKCKSTSANPGVCCGQPMKDLGPQRTVRTRELVEEIKKNVPKPEDLRKVYGAEVARARKFLIDKNLVGIPDWEKLEVIDTPELERSSVPYAAYSRPAPLDTARIGHFYVTPVPEGAPPDVVAQMLSGHNLHDVPGTVFHEAYPGHHLQFVYAKEISSKLRRIIDAPTLSEGWGLYCEELAAETGFFNGPRDRLMALNWRLQRAARVILDVGLHSGAISYEDAVKFLMENIQMERPQAEGSARNYTLSPTYYMSYLVGCLEIQRLRDSMKAKLGPRFSLREFHERFLRYGNVPPGLIAQSMQRDWN